jgi:endo-1,3-1,4-beta-glycanase ExoK
MTKLTLAPTQTIGLMCLSLAMTAQPAMAQQASFFDGFDSLSSQRWYVSDGWANGAHQNCAWAARAVTASNGMLNVSFLKQNGAGRSYICGELQTRQSYGYGTFEARLKTPAGSGLNAAFFTYIGPTQNKPHDEIDVELLLKNTNVVHTTTFVSGQSGDGVTGNGLEVPLPYPSDSDFIDYAVVWAPDKVEYYANKELIRSITTPHEIPTNPQRIFFSFWGSDTLTEWMGPFQDPGRPIAMQVDWVAYTAAGESCAFPESVSC